MIKVMNTDQEIVGTATSVNTLEILVRKALKQNHKVKLFGQLHGILFSGVYSKPQLGMIFERLAKFSKPKLQTNKVY